MTPTTTNTRPTYDEVLDTLRTAALALDIAADDLDSDDIVNPKATRNIKVWAGRLMELGNNIADALEAAGAEPRTYGDGEARYATPEAAATDSVTVWDTFDEYDYKGATRRDVIRAVLRSVGMETQEPYSANHRMTNDGQLGDGTDGQDRESYSDTQDRKSYTVSGVDYTFTEGC